MTGRYGLEGLGSDLRLRVAGAGEAECLVAAVRGFADAVLGEPPPGELAGEQEPLELAEETPADLLVALADELVLRLDADGRLGCDLAVEEVSGGTLRGRLTLVALSALEAAGVTPKAATWHGVRLEPAGEGWEGSLVLDL